MDAEYKKKSVEIKRFDCLETDTRDWEKGTLYASAMKNCVWEDGALRRGVGMSLYKRNGGYILLDGMETGMKRFFTLRRLENGTEHDCTLGLLGTNGEIYIYHEAFHEFFQVENLNEDVKFAEAYDTKGETSLVLGGETSIQTYKEFRGLSKATDSYKVKALCFAGDRVFCAVEPTMLYYSAPLDPLDFTDGEFEGGSITFPSEKGDIVGLANMLGKLFVFFERAIFVLEFAGSSRNFLIREIDYQGERIIEDSIGVCSGEKEKTYFLTENGLCVFDGAHVKKAAKNLSLKAKREGQVCVHFEFDGKYYLSFIQKNGFKRAIIVDNTTDLGYDAFVMDAFGFWNSDAICSDGDSVYLLEKDGDLFNLEKSTFISRETDFGQRGEKTLSSMIFYGFGRMKITVRCGKRVKTKTVNLDGAYTLALGFKGKKFGLEITLEKGAYLSGAEANIEYLQGNAKGELL